jgi:hypothetical protein
MSFSKFYGSQNSMAAEILRVIVITHDCSASIAIRIDKGQNALFQPRESEIPSKSLTFVRLSWDPPPLPQTPQIDAR